MKPTLNDLDYKVAAELIGCETAVIKAVAKVEAPRGGFLEDGRPVILYEPYQFADFTQNKFDGQVIQIDNKFYPLSVDRKKNPWSPANAKYGPSSIQYYKLDAAKKLDETAALKSCSWGKFQIMGSNFRACGFSSVQTMVEAMYNGEKEHLNAFIKFIKTNKIDDAMRKKDWPDIARKFNGPGFKQNKYDEKLEKAHEEFLL